MIGKIEYTDMDAYIKSLVVSTNNIRQLLKNYSSSDFSRINEFCDTIDSYSRYLTSTVQLLKDSDLALQTIIERNKTSI